MVSAGVLAALSVKHIAGRWSGFGRFARQAPYASAALIALVGLYTGWVGWQGIQPGPAEHAAASRAVRGSTPGQRPSSSSRPGQQSRPVDDPVRQLLLGELLLVAGEPAADRDAGLVHARRAARDQRDASG